MNVDGVYSSDGLPLEETVHNDDGTATVYGEGGQAGGIITGTIDVPLPEPDSSPVAAAVAAARTAVSGLSANAATRKAVEALADAVESLP